MEFMEEEADRQRGYAKVYLKEPVELRSLQKWFIFKGGLLGVTYVNKPAGAGPFHNSPGTTQLQALCADDEWHPFEVGITDYQRTKRKVGIRHLYVMYKGSPKHLDATNQMKECKELLLWICRMILGDGLIIDMPPDRILQKPVERELVAQISIEEARRRCGMEPEPPAATYLLFKPKLPKDIAQQPSTTYSQMTKMMGVIDSSLVPSAVNGTPWSQELFSIGNVWSRRENAPFFSVSSGGERRNPKSAHSASLDSGSPKWTTHDP